MDSKKAIVLLKIHYRNSHVDTNPGGYLTQQLTIFTDLYLGKDETWKEGEAQEDDLNEHNLYCSECNEKLMEV